MKNALPPFLFTLRFGFSQSQEIQSLTKDVIKNINIHDYIFII
jgi:hypothetical protein